MTFTEENSRIKLNTSQLYHLIKLNEDNFILKDLLKKVYLIN